MSFDRFSVIADIFHAIENMVAIMESRLGTFVAAEYMPAAASPSCTRVLDGTIDGMIAEANRLIEKGADGFDLLGYRYTGDAHELIRRFVSEVKAPVCLAGSVDSYEKLDEILEVSPWSFTIGSAFFDNQFDGTFAEQIDKVCDHLNKTAVAV